MTTIYLITNDQVLTFETQPKLASGDENSVILQVDFDEAWSGFAKSAVFFTGNNKTVYEIIMVNDQCVVPWEVLTDAGVLYIGIRGVISDQAAVKTSTLVKYRIVKGAPVGDGTNIEPTADVYQQMLSMMDTFMSAEELAERAEAAATNAQSAAHNASASEGNAKTYATNAQSAAATATTKANETASARDAAVAAKEVAVESAELAEELMQSVLRKNGETASGEAIRIENVLPDPYSVKVTARSKNLLPYPYLETTRTVNGITFTDNGDGSITINGTATDLTQFYLMSSDSLRNLRGAYTISAKGAAHTGRNARIAIAAYENGTAKYFGVLFGSQATHVLTESYQLRHLYIQIDKDTTFTNYVLLPQLEEGETETEWSPYVDVTAVKSRNLIEPILPTSSLNGITCINNGDGSFTLNGTATAQATFRIDQNDWGGTGNLKDYSGTYTISLKDASGNDITEGLRLVMMTYPNYVVYLQTVEKVTRTIDITGAFIYILCPEGIVLDNKKIYPMLNYGNTALPFEKYFEPRPLNVSSFGKNLLPYPYKHGTTKLNGVTFTDNGDGSITVKGTATANCFFQLTDYVTYTEGAKCFLSGCPSGGATEKYFLYAQRVGAVAVGYDMGSGVKFTASADGIAVLIAIYSGQTVDLTFYPQIELGDTATDYEPYKAGETLNYPEGANGEREFASVSPNMTLIPDAPGVVLEAVYNDTHAAFKKLQAECEKLNTRVSAFSGIASDHSGKITNLESDVSNLKNKTKDYRELYVTIEANLNTIVNTAPVGSWIGVVEGTT